MSALPKKAPALPTAYRPTDTEPSILARWESSGAYHAEPEPVLSGERKPYCIFIPPPNVTAALHLGHALTYTLQDVLTRAHRMKGFETLWMPGTDHAGIATQAVVERRVLKEEGKRRQDVSREEFIAKIQAYKDEYEATITEQLKVLGCSCDWARQRFTMDEQCARAVREAFFRLFKDGLIYRGKRLVNWDPVLQTAVADDETEDLEIDGQMYYLRYPLVHAHGAITKKEAKHGKAAPEDAVPVTWSELRRRGWPEGEDAEHGDEKQAWVTVATTRPETYLGDTAVAVNPRDPRAGALRGLSVELPLVGRVIPIVEDDYVVLPAALQEDPEEAKKDAKAAIATGFLKVTPAHDPNDYELGRRHDLAVINVMAPDASISDKHGWTDVGGAHLFVGKSREEARKLVVREFKERTVGGEPGAVSLFARSVPYKHSVPHSDRSKAAIEPYLSDQWYVKVTDDRMAQAANRALASDQRSDSTGSRNGRHATGDGELRFHPARYAKTYETWHDNIRDWCISRQLWWGHRIPVWEIEPFTHAGGINHPFDGKPNALLDDTIRRLQTVFEALGIGDRVAIRRTGVEHTTWLSVCSSYPGFERVCRLLDDLCTAEIGDDEVKSKALLRESGLPIPDLDFAHEAIGDVMGLTDSTIGSMFGWTRDFDVLDTWFSSALWPLSTLGWPEGTPELRAFNPSSVLVTAREIITLWVSRMVMFNRYLYGEGQGNGPVPFKDVFIHALLMDGEGRKMSKSLGNGVDPRDIIASHGADAMRFTLVHLTTQTQDVRMPVEPDPATGKNTSPKFDIGRNFCNKVWNAARYALSILEKSPEMPEGAVRAASLTMLDRWMLSRLRGAVARTDACIAEYQFSEYASGVYDLVWRDFCDWYLEAIKPTVAGSAAQRAVLRSVLDAMLRLLHPISPFITEAIHEHLSATTPASVAGLELPASDLLVRAAWPKADATLADEESERRFERVRALVTAVREVRAKHQVQPKRRITLHLKAALDAESDALVRTLAGLEAIEAAALPAVGSHVRFQFEGQEAAVSNLAEAVDAGTERARLEKIIADKDRLIAAIDARLNNPGYVQKAPPKLVEESKSQREQARQERDAAAQSLQGLA